jgi:hypothetical protein
MSRSAAAAENFQFFSSLGGGCEKTLRQSAAATVKKLLCNRRLEVFKFSVSVIGIFVYSKSEYTLESVSMFGGPFT